MRSPVPSSLQPASVGGLVPALAGLVVGLAVGVATSYLQGVLPGSWNRLANSGTVWSLLAWCTALAVARTRSAAVLTTTACLLGSVAGYYLLASPWRGIATTVDERTLWTLAAVVVGIPLGLAADGWARGAALGRAVAGSAVAALVLAEGCYVVLRIAPGDVVGRLEIALGAVGMLAAWLRAARTRRRAVT